MPMTPQRAIQLVLGAAAFATLTTVACMQHDPEGNAPSAVELVPIDYPGLPNVATYIDGAMSGAVPEGTEGLGSLAAMGVKTIVAVDGAAPDVEGAEALGMRYVHLPISYDEVPVVRQRELAQVLANFEGPFYFHCHHGKHRSAAALGAALIAAGQLGYPAVEARMKVSGTSHNYPGLWRSLRKCDVLEADELRADPATFPRVHETTGLVATMAELDIIYDNLKDARDANWAFSEDHPDLVPASETRRLVRLFEGLVDDRDSVSLPQSYQDQLQETIRIGRELNAAVQGNEIERATELLAGVRKSCKACHADYRNR